MRSWGVAAMAAAVALVVGLAARPGAFHNGGTGECTGCHSVHTAHPTGSELLKQSDASSVCLTCHEDGSDAGPNAHHVSTPQTRMPNGTPPLQRTPGGDFGWLKKNYTYLVDGAPVSEDGASHGHNIVAADFGYEPDTSQSVAPGGTFPSASLACTSCHDPHGRYRRLADGSIARSGAVTIASGSYASSPVPGAGQAVGAYRLLAGEGYTKGGVTFTGVPLAVAPGDYNRAETMTQTRVAYGHGAGNGRESWSRWCATCHPQSLTHGHPADIAMDTATRGTYAAYKKSGDLSGALSASYSSLVPFAENTADFATLAARARSDDTALGGPESGAVVTCLTCHRAHASGWQTMMRWNDKATYLVYDNIFPGRDTTPSNPEYARGRMSTETRAAYGDRPVTAFAQYQRTLCNKCHGMD